jgi:GT2 family glycosyltransferase
VSEPVLSVIVVTWNSREHIKACLASVARSAASLPHEVIVVDNDSGDGTAEVVARAFPAATLIRNRENRGFPKAVNQGLRRAGGRFLLLLNPDAEVVEDALPRMVRFLGEHERVGIAGCRVENPDGTLQRGCRRMLPTPRRMLFRLSGLAALFPRWRLLSEYTMTFRAENETHPVEAVSGSFLMIRRQAMERVGLMDEAFFMYGEDLDWCKRVAADGWGIMYVHDACVRHHLGQSSRKARRRTVRDLHRAGAIYYRKHLASGSPAAVNAVVLAGLWLRCRLLLAWIALREALAGGDEALPPRGEERPLADANPNMARPGMGGR